MATMYPRPAQQIRRGGLQHSLPAPACPPLPPHAPQAHALYMTDKSALSALRAATGRITDPRQYPTGGGAIKLTENQ